MAYVIAICGSGGKTTLVKNLAKKYADENKKVCITTTTHMWYDDDVKKSFIVGANFRSPRMGELCEPKCISLAEFLDKNEIESGKVFYIANLNIKKELITPLSDDDYKLVCEKFDYVIIEADGSRSMPMKIPKLVKEPVIPDNINEIIVNVGMESIGREIGAVCHRFSEFYGNDKYLSDNNIESTTIVTEKLIDEFVGHYYVKPLKETHGNAKVSVHKTIFGEGLHSSPVRSGESHSLPKRIAIVMCAAGFSKRFGSNKLFVSILNKKLYQVMIDKILGAKELLNDKFDKQNIEIDIAVVTQYDEILNDVNYNDKVIMIKNDDADKGLSQSVKLAVEYFAKCDAIVFVNADMPNLPEWEFANFIYLSVLNKNGIAAMYTDDAKNPAYFEKKYFDDLLKLEGDKGARDLLDKNIMHLYRYYINPKYLVDIDSKKDLELLNN